MRRISAKKSTVEPSRARFEGKLSLFERWKIKENLTRHDQNLIGATAAERGGEVGDGRCRGGRGDSAAVADGAAGRFFFVPSRDISTGYARKRVVEARKSLNSPRFLQNAFPQRRQRVARLGGLREVKKPVFEPGLPMGLGREGKEQHKIRASRADGRGRAKPNGERTSRIILSGEGDYGSI